MQRFLILAMMTIAVFVAAAWAAQRRPDFSGSWTLVEVSDPSARAGGSRGGSGRAGAGGSSVVSGAVVNCGSECTIIQTDATLAVSRPASRGAASPQETIVNLDGSRMPGKATLKWDGEKLVIARPIGIVTVTQTISIEDETLVVVNVFSTGDIGPITLRYRRK